MLAVIAVGGNALIPDHADISIEAEYQAAKVACFHIVDMLKLGWDVVLVHGNGPQIGFNLRRSELASHELFELPLDVCGTFTQGSIGYYFQQNLHNMFREAGLERQVVALITQVEVELADPAFEQPTKPIGMFVDAARAEQLRAAGWEVIEDSGRGYRRVVASPKPQRIVEEPLIRQLVEAGTVVIAVGGGGIPVAPNVRGRLRGVTAVIDKDFSAALLAENLGADLLLISTSVEKVAINFGKPDEQWLDEITIADAQKFAAEGHFGTGSMAPKVAAAVQYLQQGGKTAIITNQENITRALNGETGTRIVP